MNKIKTITGIMLTKNDVRVAVVVPHGASGRTSITQVAQFALKKGDSLEERLSGLEAELMTLGCGRRNLMWVACSLPEMSFATVQVEKMAINKLAPVAWLKFKKEVENLPEKVIFDYELLETEIGGVVPMWELTAFATPYDELKKIEEWFASRFKLQGITMDMFADRNLLVRSKDREETVAMLSCEKHISRIMQIKNGRTVFTRTIKTGSETLLELVERELDHPVTYEEVERILNRSESNYLLSVNSEKDQILQACSEGVNRLFIQAERALDYYTTHLKNPRPKKLYLTGNTTLMMRFIPALSSRLMLDVQLLDPKFAELSYEEEVSSALADGRGERYSTAIGAALGQMGDTPNLICTHHVKERLLKIARVRTIVASVFIGLAVLLFAGLLWQINHVRMLNSKLVSMEENPTKGLLHITTNHADEKLSEIQATYEEAVLLAERYKLAGALREVQSLTPSEILIENMVVRTSDTSKIGLMLEGLMNNSDGSGPSHLAKYVIELNASPMFSQVLIIAQQETEKTTEIRRKGMIPFKIEGHFIEILSEVTLAAAMVKEAP